MGLKCVHGYETCEDCSVAALEDRIRELEEQNANLRAACFKALQCIRERCLESLIPPGEGCGLYYVGIAAEAHDALEKALGPHEAKQG